jgi:hypothetical protein
METTVVAIISASALLLGHFVKQLLDRRSDLRARKIPIYTELLEAIQAALHVLKTKEAVTIKPEVTSKVVTWGSHEVVLAYAWLRMHLTTKEPSAPEIKEALGALLTEIRKDLGHADRQAPANFHELTAMLFFADARIQPM